MFQRARVCRVCACATAPLVALLLWPFLAGATDPPPASPLLVVREPAFNADTPLMGRVRLLDSDGTVRHDFVSRQPNDMFGLAAIILGDVNGDGVDDLAVAAPNSTNSDGVIRQGVVSVFSGHDASTLFEFRGNVDELFGIRLGVANNPVTGNTDLYILTNALDPFDLTRRLPVIGWVSYSMTDGRFSGIGGGQPPNVGMETSFAPFVRMTGASDLNSDGIVDASDMVVLVAEIGNKVPQSSLELLNADPTLAVTPVGDLNTDGTVSVDDLGQLLNEVAAGPEPGGIQPAEIIIGCDPLEPDPDNPMVQPDQPWGPIEEVNPLCGGGGSGGGDDGSDGDDPGSGDDPPGDSDPPGSGDDPAQDPPPNDGSDPGPPPPGGCEGDISCICDHMFIDIRIDLNNDGEINAADDPGDWTEATTHPGKIIFANIDDDNGNGRPDILDEPQPGDPDLVEDDDLVELQIVGSYLPPGSKWRIYGLRRYRDRQRTQPISSGWHDPADLPSAIYLEAGHAVGSGWTRNVYIQAVYFDDPNDLTSDRCYTWDTVATTVATFSVEHLRTETSTIHEDGGIRFEDTSPYALGGMAVGGAITDGASLCLVDFRYFLPAEEERIQNIELLIRKAGDSSVTDPSVLGSLHPLAHDAEPVPPLLPTPHPTPAEYGTRVEFRDGFAFYVPPLSYADSLHYPPSNSLNNLESADVEFVVLVDGHEVLVRDFKLRRPPLVLVHGLMGSANNYWGPQAYDELNGQPVPTRMYFVDYSSTNTKGYAENIRPLHDTIQEALSDYWYAHDGAHAQVRAFDGIHYAATRVDVVGHSMGGQIVRAYTSNLGDNGIEVISRGSPWADYAYDRLVDTLDMRYLRPHNFWAGSIRRFIAIGSPFKGSPIANTVDPFLRPTKRNLARLKFSEAYIRESKFYNLLVGPPGVWDSYYEPTAVADLAKGSAIQLELEIPSRYPQGHRRVPWYPLIGIATESVGDAPIQGTLWELLITIAMRGNGDLSALSDLSPATSDLVVSEWSQRNADGPDDLPLYVPFEYHVHTFEGIAPNGIFPETFSMEMSQKIRELLSSPVSHMGQGVLHE